MEGLLIFSQSNDLIYNKFNKEINIHFKKMAISHGLLYDENLSYGGDDELNKNIIIQLFSPIITTQRVMFYQFDNSYTSLQCDNINIVFDEFLGYLFINIGKKSISDLQRYTKICIGFVKHLCGPNVQSLKTIPSKKILLNNLLDTWIHLYNNDQTILVEGLDQLIVNNELKHLMIKNLKTSIEKLKQDPHSQRCHAVMFINNQLASLYSSRQAQELSPPDLLFLLIFYQSLKMKENFTDDDGVSNEIQTHLLYLEGNTMNINAGCLPHIIHLVKLKNNILILFIIEHGNINVSNNLYDIYFTLKKLQNLQNQYDIDNIKINYELLDYNIKTLQDSLKKAKYNNQDIDIINKKLLAVWDKLKKKYNELFKHNNKDIIISIDTIILIFYENLQNLFTNCCYDINKIDYGIERIKDIINTNNLIINDIIKILNNNKLFNNNNINIELYLKEFPGLIHFIYVDRITGRLITPTLNFNGEKLPLISKEKLWSMIEMTRKYLKLGQMSIMWKDIQFNYSYFLWFEDINGQSLKPKQLCDTILNTNNNNTNSVMNPGILAGQYYQRLIEMSFPKQSTTGGTSSTTNNTISNTIMTSSSGNNQQITSIANNKIKCYEIYCIHLGLVSTSCVLEHCRRLAVTINDITCIPDSLIELL